MPDVHAVILNPAANGGAGGARWKALAASPQGRCAGLADCPVHCRVNGEALTDWIAARYAAGARHFCVAD